MDSQILLFIIKLVLGGIVSFLSILIMSKTRDASWMLIVAGFLTSYAALVFDLMVELGVLSQSALLIFGIPLSSLICTVVPSLCFILAFIVKISKK
ncbi:MAG: hypothetical protein MJ160_04895 [Treponema sp.]|nr:hypothetical protein [Treponema sp.]